MIVGSGYAGASAAYWIHKSTEHQASQPQVVLLEARDICGSATGRNGGQLRPHAYSRYLPWRERFGADGAMELIRHEMAHLPAFQALAEAEGITEEVCLQFGETFDAAMTAEAWTRLQGNYDAMKADHGDDHEVVRACRLIEDGVAAEDFSQIKGALAAVVHPAGQIWPYKFVHALLRIVLAAGKLNLQAHTPAQAVSERDEDGWITVQTERGGIRTRAVVHTTNRWASHLLPEFSTLILGDRAPMAAIAAPPGFIKHTGAQHWDAAVNNYHLQLPPPYNSIIFGGGRQFLVHRPDACFPNDDEDQQIEGFADFCRTWPASDVHGWPDDGTRAEFSSEAHLGGVWTGIETTTIDSFPFVGPVPARPGHFIAAGFVGHGMPRILGSTAHLTLLVLDCLQSEHHHHHRLPAMADIFPPLPKPFWATAERVERLVKSANIPAQVEVWRKSCRESAAKPFCNDERSRPLEKKKKNDDDDERRDSPVSTYVEEEVS